ncbi:MAG: hypothetical protein Q8Q12_13205, partial [bacterium]|nr:hypothetical protein [bacterium]
RNHKCEFAPPPSLCLTSPQLPYLQPFTALPPNPLSESLAACSRVSVFDASGYLDEILCAARRGMTCPV